MAWDAKLYYSLRETTEGLDTDLLRPLLAVAESREGIQALKDEISSRLRKAEGNPKADMMAPHMKFSEYAPDDETAHPCRCWIAGRNNWGVNSTDVLHSDEYLDGVQARYEAEHDL
jgi:hypothetical protein